MADETVVAESSSAPVAMEVDRGPLVNMTGEQRAEFRRTGTLPEAPKTEDPAPSGTVEEPKDDAGASPAPTKPQEHVDKSKAKTEQRFQKLLEERNTLKKELEALKTPKPAETPKPQPRQEAPQPAQQEPQPDDKNADGTPKYKTYEELTKAIARWELRQELAEQERARTAKAQATEFQSRVDEAKSRYGAKFDEVLTPTVNAIMSDQAISPAVRGMLNDSEVLPDLLFTIGSDAKELATFLDLAKKTPGKALRYIALTESLIREELESKLAPKDTKPPVKPQTSAPKPPSEVGGRASTPADTLETAAKAGDFRSYKAERTRRDLARLKG